MSSSGYHIPVSGERGQMGALQRSNRGQSSRVMESSFLGNRGARILWGSHDAWLAPQSWVSRESRLAHVLWGSHFRWLALDRWVALDPRLTCPRRIPLPGRFTPESRVALALRLAHEAWGSQGQRLAPKARVAHGKRLTRGRGFLGRLGSLRELGFLETYGSLTTSPLPKLSGSHTQDQIQFPP